MGRIAALSDGIFAFAATVLMLDFRSPEPADIHSEAELLRALAASAHRLLPWLLSLMTLGIFWVAQQTQLNHLARSNRDLTWLHLAFLAIITVLPFSTRLFADFFTYRSAFLIYWANIFLLGVAVYVTSAYAERAKLIREDAPPELSRRDTKAGHRRPVALRNRRDRRPLQCDARHCADHPDPAQLRGRAEAALPVAPLAVRIPVQKPGRLLIVRSEPTTSWSTKSWLDQEVRKSGGTWRDGRPRRQRHNPDLETRSAWLRQFAGRELQLQ